MMSGFDAPYWNALQVLAWVYLRDRALVARCGNETNSTHGWYWRDDRVLDEDGGVRNVLYKEPSGPATTLTLVVEAAVRGGTSARYAAIEDAEQDILDKLKAGALSVTGRQNGHPRQEIPALQWQDLNIEYEENSAVDKDKFSGRIAYDHLSFSREAVLKPWPDVAQADADRALLQEIRERELERQREILRAGLRAEKEAEEFAKKEALQRLEDADVANEAANSKDATPPPIMPPIQGGDGEVTARVASAVPLTVEALTDPAEIQQLRPVGGYEAPPGNQAEAKKTTRRGGRNPGDGAKDDVAEIDGMRRLIATDKANSPHAAALKIVEESRDKGEKPAEYAHRRLDTKFRAKYAHQRRDGESWRDCCRRIEGELQSK